MNEQNIQLCNKCKHDFRDWSCDFCHTKRILMVMK